MAEINTKRCTHCGETKPATLEYFYACRNTLGSWCRACTIARASLNKRSTPPEGLKRLALVYAHSKRGSAAELEARDALIVAVLEHVEKSRAAA